MLKQRATGGAALLACIVVTTASAAQAKDLYLCDCGPNADAECEPGSDENTSASPNEPLRSWERAREFVTGEAQCGDRILFCRGGQFAASAENRWYSGSLDCKDDPIVTGSYRPAWTTRDVPAPIIETPGTAFTFLGNPAPRGGYVFQDLDVRCRRDGGSCGRDDSNGFFLLENVHHVTIERVRVDGFQQGIHLNAWGGPPTDVVVRKSIIVNNSRQGILGGADRLRVLDNYVMNNGCIGEGEGACKFDHNLYISGVRQDMWIRGNVLSGAARDPEGNCHGAEIVLRGGERVVVENNLVYEPLGKADPHCFGITGTADVDGVRNGCVDCVIRNNRFENVSNAIDLFSIQRTTIENNHITFPHAEGSRGHCSGIHAAAAAEGMLGDGDLATDAVTIRNNSIYFGRDGECTGIRVADQGRGHAIANNAIYAGGPASVSCLELPSTPSNVSTLSTNLCFAESGAIRWNGETDVARMEELYGGHGNQTVDPGFRDPEANDLTLRDGSPSIHGADASAVASADRTEAARDERPDVGAYEHGLPASEGRARRLVGIRGGTGDPSPDEAGDLEPTAEGLTLLDEEFALIRHDFPANPRGGIATTTAGAFKAASSDGTSDVESEARLAAGPGCHATPFAGSTGMGSWPLFLALSFLVSRSSRRHRA